MKKFDCRVNAAKPAENGVYILSDKTITDFMKYLDDLVYKVTHDGEYYVEVITENYNVMVVIDKDYMGESDKVLGKVLMKGYLSNLRDMSLKPDVIALYNDGVKLLIEEDFKEVFIDLINSGVEIISCGTCLKYFNIAPEIGSTTNMFNIIAYQMRSKKVLRP